MLILLRHIKNINIINIKTNQTFKIILNIFNNDRVPMILKTEFQIRKHTLHIFLYSYNI